jgi:hypothetical protein
MVVDWVPSLQTSCAFATLCACMLQTHRLVQPSGAAFGCSLYASAQFQSATWSSCEDCRWGAGERGHLKSQEHHCACEQVHLLRDSPGGRPSKQQSKSCNQGCFLCCRSRADKKTQTVQHAGLFGSHPPSGPWKYGYGHRRSLWQHSQAIPPGPAGLSQLQPPSWMSVDVKLQLPPQQWLREHTSCRAHRHFLESLAHRHF